MHCKLTSNKDIYVIKFRYENRLKVHVNDPKFGI